MMHIGDPGEPNLCGSKSNAFSPYSLMCPSCARIARERGYPASRWWNRRYDRHAVGNERRRS